MGTLAQLLAVLGLLAGYLSARFAHYEMKDGKKYFVLLQHALLATLIGMITWAYRPSIAIIVGIVFFLFLWKFSMVHQLKPTAFCLGLLTGFYSTELVTFLYFIPSATLNYKDKKNLLFGAGLYIVGVLVTTLF